MSPNPNLPYRIPADRIPGLDRDATEVADRSQYGWGQTVEIDGWRREGFLGAKWVNVLAEMTDRGWLPEDLSGMTVVDIGCFSGAQTLALAARGADRVIGVEEVPEHLDQARLLVDRLDVDNVDLVESTLYALRGRIEPGTADVVLLSGVLYHLSDMLVGLIAASELLRPGGKLLIQTNAVECFDHSYANFGRFYAGWWWQPTGLCIQDMTEHAGMTRADVHFYEPGRCIAVAEMRAADRPDGPVPFRRGVNWPFEDLTDAEHRHLDAGAMAPAPDLHAQARLLSGWLSRVAEAALRLPLRVAAWVRARTS